MDAGSRQSASLPSISHMDIEKNRRDESDFQRKHSAAAMVSPSFPYSCPPPPYSHHSTAASAPPNGLAGLISPPESRRTSGDDKEQNPRPPARQSLPSIHEALASEQHMPYPPPTPTAPQPANHYPPPPTSAPVPETNKRPFPPDIYSHERRDSYHPPGPRSPYMKPPPPAVSGPQYPPPQPEVLNRRAPTLPNSHNPKLPTLHPIRTDQSPGPSARNSFSHGNPYPPPPPPQQSPAYEQPAPPVGPMHQPYGYQYGPGYPYSAPPPPSNTGPMYPAPATNFSAPAGYPSNWRSDGAEVRRAEESKRAGRMPGLAYGESVKRHLDNFDFEASLNEIAEGSGRLNEFVRVYGQRAHQTQRTGPMPNSTPNIAEVDDLMKQGSRIVDSLAQIRNVVITQQQVALAEQAQDPRFGKAANGYEPEDSHSYSEDAKGGGFAGSDPKKRRGRAAPPGRCHSCNRAETPEWRRGPDGARTLCNACGLHYAKLTRKMGANKAPIGSSNLRPKSLGPGSPSN
ncbi:hypothetical protein K490DRAFT_65810 [Saccharata proteae CBS 121410]|uniref:GATA-type domain-containing protein n=1 Tax=Saccharata proteae CBS 121410 TaxID=1314787 RepID=A0A9P4HVC9_9PEZI|nr:hypothetical protein K490DRAFT_65810 [Saccharata proteae CBS 121410]